MSSIPVGLLPIREYPDADRESGISIEDHATVMQNNQQASQAPNGRDLAFMLGVKDKTLLDSWNLGKHYKTTFKRLRDANEQHLRGVVRNLLCYRGLQESAGGNWAPILEMHCFEVRDNTQIIQRQILVWL